MGSSTVRIHEGAQLNYHWSQSPILRRVLVTGGCALIGWGIAYGLSRGLKWDDTLAVQAQFAGLGGLGLIGLVAGGFGISKDYPVPPRDLRRELCQKVLSASTDRVIWQVWKTQKREEAVQVSETVHPGERGTWTFIERDKNISVLYQPASGPVENYSFEPTAIQFATDIETPFANMQVEKAGFELAEAIVELRTQARRAIGTADLADLVLDEAYKSQDLRPRQVPPALNSGAYGWGLVRVTPSGWVQRKIHFYAEAYREGEVPAQPAADGRPEPLSRVHLETSAKRWNQLVQQMATRHRLTEPTTQLTDINFRAITD
jgi:hypothetical protein